MSPTRPEDLIADGVDTAVINGTTVRKGSIGAFLANLETLEHSTSSAEKAAALNMMRELAPAITAIGLHKYVIFKNQQAQQLLDDAAKDNE